VVGLLEAGEGEGAWDEEAGGGGGGWGGLMGVEGAAVVFWGAEAVAVWVVSGVLRDGWGGGGLGVGVWCFFECRLTGWVVVVFPAVGFWLWGRMT
jgi:hypothetical protein